MKSLLFKEQAKEDKKGFGGLSFNSQRVTLRTRAFFKGDIYCSAKERFRRSIHDFLVEKRSLSVLISEEEWRMDL